MSGSSTMLLDRRRIAVAAEEDIAEADLELRHRLGESVAGYRRVPGMEDLPDIVDAVAMIGMVVGPQDRIDVEDIRVEQLLAHVGRSIDE